MLDYQKIVDDARSIMFIATPDGDDFLQATAADYSLAIDEANERLRKCGVLLRKGLRSEAIQLCEVEPNLLDVVETIDFPERESWNELLASHGLTPPATLMLEVATGLNDAYAVEQPLAALLQRHRLLAMSHAPLRLRVDTLRSLAEADPENPVWDQDARTFEQERLKELKVEASQAIAREDADSLESLAGELGNPGWRVECPEELLAKIKAARLRAAQRHALVEMRRVVDELHAMHAAYDVEGGRRLRAELQPLVERWGHDTDPALLAETVAPLDWLREQDDLEAAEFKRREAAANLLKALGNQTPEAELDRLHSEAERYGEIPLHVEKRYRAAIASFDRAARRRLKAAAAIFAAFVLVGGGLVGTFVYQYYQAAKTDRARASLERLVQDNNFDEARSLLDQLTAESPQIAADQRIQEINSMLTKQARDEAGRRKALETAMALLQSSIADQLPDADALAQAKKVAKTDDEIAAIRKAEQNIARLAAAAQAKADQDFLSQIKGLQDRANAIEKDIDDKPDESIEKLNRLQSELARLQQASPRAGEASRQQDDSLHTRLKELEDAAIAVNDRHGAEEAITAACGDNVAFRQKLRDYASKFPQARRSGSFHAVAEDEAPLWDWIEHWNNMSRAIGKASSAGFTRAAAADMASRVRKLLDERPGHPDADAFRRRLPYLDAIVQRTNGDGDPIEASLKPVFGDPLVSGVWMLATKSGERYYLLEDPAVKLGDLRQLKADNHYGFDYVSGFDLSKAHKSIRGDNVDADESVAPQRETARILSGILKTTTDASWEPSFCRMAQTVLDDPDTDPLLKQFLLRKIVEVGCQGSLCMRNGFSEVAKALKESKAPASVNWVDPSDAQAKKQRPIAESELRDLPKFADVQSSVAREQRWLRSAVGTQVSMVGWLRQNTDGHWQCVTKMPGPTSGKLVIVRAAQGSDNTPAAATFEAVGHLDHGKAVIDLATGDALAEGRPVFIGVPAQ